MLPQKYYDDLPPTRNAAARIIFRALLDYVHNRKWANSKRIPRNKRERTAKLLYEESRSWLFDNEIEVCSGCIEVENNFVAQEEAVRLLQEFEYVMSFESACGVLGWDPGWIRKRIVSLKEEDLRRVAKRNGFL
jgi:hypothetical protein